MSEQVIEIPSKRIYDNQNPKIIKNKYATSSIDMKSAQRRINADTIVRSEEQFSSDTTLDEVTTTYTTGSTGANRPLGIFEVEDFNFAHTSNSQHTIYNSAGAFVGATTRYHSINIIIPKKRNYGLDDVLSVKSGTTDDVPDIKVSITNKIISRPLVLNIKGTFENESINGYSWGEPVEEVKAEDFYRWVGSSYSSRAGTIPRATASVGWQDKVVISGDIVKENDTNFEVNIVVQTYCYSCGGAENAGGSVDSSKSWTYQINCTTEEHIPQKVSVSVYGNIMEFEIDNYVYEDGDETHANNIFNPESNELFQNNTKVGNTQIDKYMSDTVLGGWQNGKETAEIQCSVNDYKSIMPLSGKVGGDAISTSNSTLPFMFRVGNVVCPMTATVSGDKPISTFDFKWGSSTAKFPKLFRVTGISPKYDGALWQTLTLQETYPQYNVTIDTTNAKGMAVGSLIHNVTSSRCTKGSFSSTKPHYGDTMYIEFRTSTGYTGGMNISGSAGTTYKSVTKSIATQNRYTAWVYGIADDFDVTITTSFNIIPPRFTSVTSDGVNTWAFREVCNDNSFTVTCKVDVILDGTVSTTVTKTINAHKSYDAYDDQTVGAGNLDSNKQAKIVATFTYVTVTGEVVTSESTMIIGGELDSPEIGYAQYSDGTVEVEIYNPNPVSVTAVIDAYDENQITSNTTAELTAFETKAVSMSIDSSLDLSTAGVNVYFKYREMSSGDHTFDNSATEFAYIE